MHDYSVNIAHGLEPRNQPTNICGAPHMLGMVIGTRTVPLAAGAVQPRGGTSIIDTVVCGGSVILSLATVSKLLNVPGLQFCCL